MAGDMKWSSFMLKDNSEKWCINYVGSSIPTLMGRQLMYNMGEIDSASRTCETLDWNFLSF